MTRQTRFRVRTVLSKGEKFDVSEYINTHLKGIRDVTIEDTDKVSIVDMIMSTEGAGDFDMQVLGDEISDVVEAEVEIINDEIIEL